MCIISLFFMNTILKHILDEEYNKYNNLPNLIIEAEYNSNMRRLGESKNNYKFTDTFLYLSKVESVLKEISKNDKKV